MLSFYCAGGKFGEVAGVFLTHRMLATEASDAVSVRPVCSQCLAQLGLGTGRQAPNAGLSLFVCPVVRVRCAVRLQTSLRMRPVSTERSGAQRPVIELSADLSVFKSGEYRTRPVVT